MRARRGKSARSCAGEAASRARPCPRPGAATRRPVSRSTSRSRKARSNRALCAAKRSVSRESRESDGPPAPSAALASGLSSRIPVSAAMLGGRAEPGLTSVSNVSSMASARTRAAPISQMRQRLAERPVVSRSKTTNSASSIEDVGVRRVGRARRAHRARRAEHHPRRRPSSNERASAAGARSSANSTWAASSAATGPRRACTSSTSRSAASNVSCMRGGYRTYVRISSAPQMTVRIQAPNDRGAASRRPLLKPPRTPCAIRS